MTYCLTYFLKKQALLKMQKNKKRWQKKNTKKHKNKNKNRTAKKFHFIERRKYSK